MDIALRAALLLAVTLLSACASVAPNASTEVLPNARINPHVQATALPGNGASALPGSHQPCGIANLQAIATCPIAISDLFAPLKDPLAPLSLIPGLHPADLRAIYHLPSNGSGGTVAVVDAFDDPLAEVDLAVYRLTFGLPPCLSLTGCFRKINERGFTLFPKFNAAWSQEIALDLDMVSAVCPKCKILLVEADSPSIADLASAVDAAAAAGATAISNSYYAPEWTGEAALDVHYNHPGIAITAASGDQALPYYPAASPYVTAVGGTTVTSVSGWQQQPWAYGGQGCSAYEPLPAFQANTGCQTRSTVDVAVVADPQSGVASFSTLAGGWVVAGGTSIGAPVVAAAYALSGRPNGPGFSYAHAGNFQPIGSPGYQPATGLGAPNGVGGL